MIGRAQILRLCYDKWISQASKYATLPAIVCWNIWLERNRAIFEDGSPTVDSVVFKSCGSFIKPSVTLQVSLLKPIRLF
jgi:hypothetical protein